MRRPLARWRPLDRLTLLLVVGFVLVSLGPALVGAQMMLDANLLTRFLPFSAIDGVHTASTVICRGDTIDGFFPSFVDGTAQVRAGHLQTWAPWESGGGAYGALPSYALFSPLTLPYYVLPGWLAPAFVKLLEMAVGIVGMLGLARRHGLSRAAGLLGGAVFAATGFLTMWTNWPHPQVAAFVPMLFWGLECVVRERRPRFVVGVALVLACMLLGGFPVVVLYALTLGGAYVLVRALQLYGVTGRAVGALLRAAAGVVLGVALTAVQMVPFVLDLRTFTAGREGIGGTPLPLENALTTVAPGAFGLCRGGESYGRVNVVEGVGFVGSAALVLALLAVVRLPRGDRPGAGLQRFGAVALPVVAVLVWVGGPLLAALQVLPFYGDNPIGRAQSVLGFVAAAMCAVGFDRLVTGTSGRSGASGTRAARVWTVLVSLGVLVLAVLALRAGLAQSRSAGGRGVLDRSLLVALALVVVTVLLCVVAARRDGSARTVALGLVVLLALGQSAYFLREALPHGDRRYLYPVTPTHAFLQQHLGHQRYAATGDLMYAATSEAYRLRTPTGHQFTQPTWVDLLEAVDPRAMLSRTFSQLDVAPRDAGQQPVLDQLAVKYWVGRPDAVTGRPAAPFPARPTETVRLRPGGAQSCTVPAGPMRAVQVQVADREVRRAGADATLRARVETPRGTLTGASMLPAELGAGSRSVPVVGEDLPAGGTDRVTVTLTGTKRALVLGAAGSAVRCRAVRPADDGLRLVSASAGAVVYQRLDALPRVRWAGRSRVVADPDEQVRLLDRGVPRDTVLLDDDGSPAAGGGDADVAVTRDSGPRVTATVRAATGGYLLVADAVVRQGWSATVDGQRVPLVRGNHAFGAVHVPAGRHRVSLSYAQPGLRAGGVVSALAGVVTLALLVGPWWARRRRPTGTVAQVHDDEELR